MRYNVFVKTQNNTFNILDISPQELESLIDLYNYGKGSIFIKGKKYWFSKLLEIQIYSFDHHSLKSESDLVNVCEREEYFEKGYFSDKWIPVKVLEQVGDRLTDDFIKGDYGYLKIDEVGNSLAGDTFVDIERIKELKNITSGNYDYSKLIQFLNELNFAYLNNAFLTIPLLVRAVVDHIPPIFNKSNFSEVCGGYGTKSFKDSMTNLDKSNRKIADSYLHTHIRQKESLPNKTQINFKHDLDVLLQEIVRVNK